MQIKVINPKEIIKLCDEVLEFLDSVKEEYTCAIDQKIKHHNERYEIFKQQHQEYMRYVTRLVRWETSRVKRNSNPPEVKKKPDTRDYLYFSCNTSAEDMYMHSYRRVLDFKQKLTYADEVVLDNVEILTLHWMQYNAVNEIKQWLKSE